MTWRYIDTGFHPGAWNMAFDRMLARTLAEQPGTPTLRFYGWNPPAISLGFHQGETDFDLNKLQHDKIDIVRRPTGGRAILHWHELTYSVVMEFGNETPKSLYALINKALLRGLTVMGIQAELSGAAPDFPSLYQNPSSIPCFSSSAKHEIQAGGKKLIGSAQRRYGNVLLQHGSFLLGNHHRRLTRYLAPHLKEAEKEMEEALLAKTTEAETFLGHPISFNEAAEAMRTGFEMEWGIRLQATSAEAELPALLES